MTPSSAPILLLLHIVYSCHPDNIPSCRRGNRVQLLWQPIDRGSLRQRVLPVCKLLLLSPLYRSKWRRDELRFNVLSGRRMTCSNGATVLHTGSDEFEGRTEHLTRTARNNSHILPRMERSLAIASHSAVKVRSTKSVQLLCLTRIIRRLSS